MKEEKHMSKPHIPDKAITVGRKGRDRNQPCPCNSGKKLKNCCWNRFKPKELL